MGKALVIKNVNFSDNKLTTVLFTDPVPCTSISLNTNAITMTSLASTVTLTATITPANTTDAVIWNSSNIEVATVANGVVTQTGAGSAIITATCGDFSATCTVTATYTLIFADLSYDIGRSNHKGSGTGVDYIINETSSSVYAAVESTTATTKRIWYYSGTGNRYPIVFNSDVTSIQITTSIDVRITAWFLNSEEACDYSTEHPTYDYLAKVISGDSSAYDKNVPVGNRTLTVPSGANSIVFSVQYPNNSLSTSDMLLISALFA